MRPGERGELEAIRDLFAAEPELGEQREAGSALAFRVPAAPGWHCLAAYNGHEPVATSALFVTGELGWLGLGATLPTHRGRGAQNALLAARITLAADLGLALVVTETGVPRDGQPGPS